MSWIVTIRVLDEERVFFEEFFASFFEAVTTLRSKKENFWLIRGFSSSPPHSLTLETQLAVFSKSLNISPPKMNIRSLKEQNWVERFNRIFSPIRVGRFLILDKYYMKENLIGKILLNLSASNAFGTGQHETTQGCLHKLEYLAKRHNFQNILDIGCGSGILSIASAKIWHSQVTAIDIDKDAVGMTKFNSKRNNVVKYIQVNQADGCNSALVRRLAPYDLIICNILAPSLIKIARHLVHNLQPPRNKNSYAILSGILNKQSNQIIALYRNHGLKLISRLIKNNWQTLLFRL